MRLTRMFAGLTAGAALVAGVAVATAGPSAAQAQEGRRSVDGWRSDRLAAELHKSVVAQNWHEVLDTDPVQATARLRPPVDAEVELRKYETATPPARRTASLVAPASPAI